MLKIESGNEVVKDGQTDGRTDGETDGDGRGCTDTQRKFLNGWYNIIPRTFQVAVYKNAAKVSEYDQEVPQ